MPRIQLRRDTSSNWSSTNPTLYAGEIGVETDTMSFKLGDGSTNWNSLAYTSLPDGVNDGDVLTWNSSTNSWQAEAPTGGGGSLPNGVNNNDVLVWNSSSSSWEPQSGVAGNQWIPAGTNNRDILVWNSSANSWEAQYYVAEGANQGDLLQWDSTTNNWVATGNSGAVHGHIVFWHNGNSSWTLGGLSSNSTPNNGDVIVWDGTNSSWTASSINPGNLPNGASDGQVLTWDGMNSSWGAESVPTELPSSATTGHVLTWTSNNSWEPQAPSGGSATLPSATIQGEQLIYNAAGASWYAAGATNSGGFLAYNQGSYGFNGIRPGPSDAVTSDILYYNGSYWEARPYVGVGASPGDLLQWDSTGNNWVATNNSGAVNGNIVFWHSGNASWTLGGATSMNASPNNGDVLTWDATSGAWYALPAPGSLPSASNTNDVMAWNGTSWSPANVACILPSASNGDVLTYNSGTGCWAGTAPSAAGLPSASSDNQVMQYNNSTSQWEAGVGLDNGITSQDFLVWDSANNKWTSTGFATAPTTGNIAFNQSGSWVLGGLTDGPSGSTPANGDVLTWNNTSSYWEASPILPSGASDGQVLTWDGMNSSWGAETAPGALPSGSAEHDILVWNTTGNSWTNLNAGSLSDGHILNVAASGSQWTLGGKTAANGNPATNDLLQWNGNNWVAATIPTLPGGSLNAWDIMYWNSGSSAWLPANLSISSGSPYVPTFDGTSWVATQGVSSSSIVIVDVSSSSHTLSFTNGVLTSYSIT